MCYLFPIRNICKIDMINCLFLALHFTFRSLINLYSNFINFRIFLQIGLKAKVHVIASYP